MSSRLISSNISHIPKDWKNVKIKDIVKEVKSGFASGKREDDGVIQLRMNNISTSGKVLLESYIKVPRPYNLNNYLVKKGDILFNNTNSIDLVGKTAIVSEDIEQEIAFSNHITRIRVDNEQIMPEWLLLNLIRKFQLGYFKSICVRHVGQSGIRYNDLLSIELNLPNLNEQRKIISIIESVDLAIQETTKILEKLKLYRKGLMQKLFSSEINNSFSNDASMSNRSKEVNIVKLGTVCEVGTGSTPLTSVKEYYNGDIPFIRTAEITNNIIDSAKYLISKKAVKDYSLKVYPPKTIFLAMYGQGKTRGQVSLLNIEATTSQNTAAIITNTKEIDPIYLWYYLQHIYSTLRRSGMLGHISHLNLEEVKKQNVPKPSLSKQQGIASILLSVDEKIEIEKNQAKYIENLKKGLTNDLLLGKKRTIN